MVGSIKTTQHHIRCFSSTAGTLKMPVNYKALKKSKVAEYSKIPEIQFRDKFKNGILSLTGANLDSSYSGNGLKPIPDSSMQVAIVGGIATFLLHCEARIASSIGQGFYTIGPCGEELLSVVSCNLRESDATIGTWRHLYLDNFSLEEN
jgi:hypothetical protein